MFLLQLTLVRVCVCMCVCSQSKEWRYLKVEDFGADEKNIYFQASHKLKINFGNT